MPPGSVLLLPKEVALLGRCWFKRLFKLKPLVKCLPPIFSGIRPLNIPYSNLAREEWNGNVQPPLLMTVHHSVRPLLSWVYK